jgi:hypothetical protein
MPRHWSDIEPALPPTVVADIWAEINAQAEPPQTFPEKLQAFVEVAIDHPHYASAREIADALGETYNRVNPVVFHAKDNARRNRMTSGT